MMHKLKKILVFHVWVVPLFAGYAAFFLVFYPVLGESVTIFAFLPPVIIAWKNGVRNGIIAVPLAILFMLALLHFEHVKSLDIMSLLHRSPGIVSVFLIAAIVGYMSDLRKRLNRELENKNKIELKLRASELHFKAIFEGSNDALMLLTEKGFFDCNPRTLEMFGFTRREDFLRVHPADISPAIQPDGRESFPAAQERIGEAFQKGTNRFEWIHRRTNGEDFAAEVLLSSFNLNGKQVLEATVRDISKRKKAEQALAESEASFKSMFELTSEGVTLISPITGRFVAANPAMCSLLGYTEQEFLALTPEDITPLEAKGIMQNSMKTLFNSDNVKDHEGLNVKKDGTIINVLVRCNRLEWKSEQVFYVTFKDVTYLKLIQQRLSNKNRELLDFTNSVTHDLKKPLTTIKTVYSLMQMGAFGELTSEGKEAICMGAGGISYMQELLDDLLASAQLEAGVHELSRENVDLNALASEVVSLLKFQMGEKKVGVIVDENLGFANVDKKDITKVFMNLIGNAINYIGEGTDRMIVIGTKAAETGTTYFVKDNGIGIPDESQKELFQKFKRGSNVSGISGTGLGLSIVKGIIEAHGGKIWVESTVGEGTTFYFKVPSV